jgi:hypothetical protein
MPRRQLRARFLREYGEVWTVGFAAEAFVVCFLAAGGDVLEARGTAVVVALAALVAAAAFACTALSDKAYAVMAAMSAAEANGGDPMRSGAFAPNYAAMVGVSELVASVHSALLSAAAPATLQIALTPAGSPASVTLAWALFLAAFAGGLVTIFQGHVVFACVLFYCMCWMPVLEHWHEVRRRQSGAPVWTLPLQRADGGGGGGGGGEGGGDFLALQTARCAAAAVLVAVCVAAQVQRTQRRLRAAAVAVREEHAPQRGAPRSPRATPRPPPHPPDAEPLLAPAAEV